jgi:hypothetical protein
MTDTSKTKEILKAAHAQILALQKDNESLKSDLDAVLQAQAQEADQLAQMSEQLWKLEEALLKTSGDKDAALMMLKKLKNDVDRLHDFVEQTLAKATDKNTSRLKVAVQVFEMKSMVEQMKKL